MPRNTRGPTLSSNKVPTVVRKEVHTQRKALVLAVAVMAAAFPMMLPFSPASGDASAEVVTMDVATPSSEAPAGPAASPRPSLLGGAAESDDAPQTVSMLLVGTLLIGIGTAVRRAA